MICSCQRESSELAHSLTVALLLGGMGSVHVTVPSHQLANFPQYVAIW